MTKNMAGLVLGVVMGTMAAGMAFSAQAAQIGLEQAKQTALAAAGLTEDQVIFKTAGTDYDDGREIFEVDFFVTGEVKYEFDIDANTGAILDQDMDYWDMDDDFEYAALIQAAQSGKTAAVPAKAATGEITEAQAKEIAIQDAGLGAGECKVVKCRKDMDDGVLKFEIKLRTANGTEYDYDIRVSDGRIIDRDIDYNDWDDDGWDFDLDFDWD